MKLSVQVLFGIVLVAQLAGCVYVDGGRRHWGWHRQHHPVAVIDVNVR